MVEGTKPIDYYTDDKGIVHPIFDAGVIAGLTVGSVLFAGAGGIISQDNSNLFWDDTNKRLGIGTASPDDKLHIVDTRTANESAALFIQHTGSTPAGASYGIVVEKTGAASRTNVGASFSAAGADNNYGLLVPYGKVGIGTDDPDVALDVNGYTQLGSNAPKIKIKKLTGTTNAAEGGTTTIAHGVTSSKIISMTTLVFNTAVAALPPEWLAAPGYQYHANFDVTLIYIENHTTNSEQILSKPIVVTILYEE